MKTFHLAVPLALASLLAVVPAASAQARDWQPITGHESMVLATCSDGSQVISADLSDPRRNRFVMEPILDQDGNVTGMLLMLKYAGYFAHSVSDELIWGSGTDRIVMDFVTGTETHTGNRWTVAIEGEGWVVKEAGQITTRHDRRVRPRPHRPQRDRMGATLPLLRCDGLTPDRRAQVGWDTPPARGVDPGRDGHHGA